MPNEHASVETLYSVPDIGPTWPEIERRGRTVLRKTGVGLMVKAIEEGTRDMLASMLGRWILGIFGAGIVGFLYTVGSFYGESIRQQTNTQAMLIQLKEGQTRLANQNDSITNQMALLRDEINDVKVESALLHGRTGKRGNE